MLGGQIVASINVGAISEVCDVFLDPRQCRFQVRITVLQLDQLLRLIIADLLHHREVTLSLLHLHL